MPGSQTFPWSSLKGRGFTRAHFHTCPNEEVLSSAVRDWTLPGSLPAPCPEAQVHSELPGGADTAGLALERWGEAGRGARYLG